MRQSVYASKQLAYARTRSMWLWHTCQLTQLIYKFLLQSSASVSAYCVLCTSEIKRTFIPDIMNYPTKYTIKWFIFSIFIFSINNAYLRFCVVVIYQRDEDADEPRLINYIEVTQPHTRKMISIWNERERERRRNGVSEYKRIADFPIKYKIKCLKCFQVCTNVVVSVSVSSS